MVSIINQPETKSFLSYLDQWMDDLQNISLSDLAEKPEKVAIISVDVIKGFCNQGALSSPRVAGIVRPIVELMNNAWDNNIRNIILSQDTHEQEAVEFSSWPPHCIRSTQEAETVDEIKQLPFFDKILVLVKNSIASGLNKDLQQWVLDHPEVDKYIVVGDCSDLCTYQLAMFLRLDANERQLQREVILPENCVQTYDLPVETALDMGAFPHPGDLIHNFFLNHMALNGVKVVKKID
jgi:nicotinamidase-related amidase